jgi:TolB-like protein/Flp pilus assembly protein TadD
MSFCRSQHNMLHPESELPEGDDLAQPQHEPTGESTVFVSYSRADQKHVFPVVKMLEDAGYSVWWDGMLGAGEHFASTTEQALTRAKAVVVLWSKQSIASHWVHDEATQGRDRRCLVPISIDGSEAPLGFRQFQVIDVSKARGKAASPAYQLILRAVAALHDRPYERPAPAKSGITLDRRLLLGGGAVLAGGGLAAWATGLIGGKAISATSVAVLPFDNLSGDKAQDYFSDGLAAELRAQLSRNKLLQVAAQASSNIFRDGEADARTISSKLRVAYLVDGNVRRGDNGVKVSVELVNGRTGAAQTSDFEAPLDDLFALQNNIATHIAGQLSAQIDPGKKADDLTQSGGTKSVAAYDAYLRGKDLYDSGVDEASDRAALAKFDEAIAEDPKYAAAHAARSRSLAVIAGQYDRGEERTRQFAEGTAAARRAVALAPRFAEAWSALGFALSLGQLQIKEARVAYRKSWELGPGDADILSRFAVFSSRLREDDVAGRAIAQATALDPLNARTFRSSGDIAYLAGRYDAAIAANQKALDINPKLSGAHAYIGFARILQGKLAEAESAFAAESGEEARRVGMSIIAYKRGNRADGAAMLAKMQADYGDKSLYQYAQIYAQAGETEPALAALQSARAKGDNGLILLYSDPMLEPLRSLPAFSNLLMDIGFV